MSVLYIDASFIHNFKSGRMLTEFHLDAGELVITLFCGH
jgi:hypothetical protein